MFVSRSFHHSRKSKLLSSKFSQFRQKRFYHHSTQSKVFSKSPLIPLTIVGSFFSYQIYNACFYAEEQKVAPIDELDQEIPNQSSQSPESSESSESSDLDDTNTNHSETPPVEEEIPSESNDEEAPTVDTTPSNSSTMDELLKEIQELKGIITKLGSSSKAKDLIVLRKELEKSAQQEYEHELSVLEAEFDEKLAEINNQARKTLNQLKSKAKQQVTETNIEFEQQIENLRADFQKQFATKVQELNDKYSKVLEQNCVDLDAIYLEQFYNQINQLHQEFDYQNEHLNENIKILFEKLRTFRNQITARSKLVSIETLQRQCLEFIHLSNQVESHQPFANSLASFRKLAANDELLSLVLNGIPSKITQSGAWTISDLNQDFQALKPILRSAAYMPKDGGIAWKLWGFIVSKMSFPVKGLVTGSDPDSVISRAEYYLLQGDLEKSMEELESFQGAPRQVVDDWIKLAKQRFILDISLSFVRSRIINHIMSSAV